MGKILTISGLKGGIGKSTIAVNLAASLALYEKKVLLVDCDPRGCATEWIIGNDAGCRHEMSLVLGGATDPEQAVVKTLLTWLDILPASFDLFETALKLSKIDAGEILLRKKIQEMFNTVYEYVIIDSPPSFGFLSAMAMAAADWLIIPICPNMTSKTDSYCQFKLSNHIRKNYGIPLKIGGFVFNRCNTRDDVPHFLQKEQLARIADLVYSTHIPEDIHVKRSFEKKIPLALHDIKTPAGNAFLRFAREIDLIFRK